MKDIGKIAESLGYSEEMIPGSFRVETIKPITFDFMPFREYPKEYIRRVKTAWWIFSPFQIENYAKYTLNPLRGQLMNPCGEIKLPWKGWCRLGFREVDSPFNLTSFTEPYYVRGTIDDYPD